MTTLRLNQVSTTLNQEGKQAIGAGGSLDFASTDLQQDKLIADVKYNGKKGQLVIVRKNGELVTIGGLPTIAMFGQGLPGKRGGTGQPGKDGRNGRDGSTGLAGCAGRPGARGLDGIDGDDGDDGEDGEEGIQGYAGKPGPDGATGPTGPTGPDGPRGNDGPNCISGSRGATGPAPIETAVVSATTPEDRRIGMWLFPTANVTPAPPLPVIVPLSASVSSISTVGTRIAPNSDLFAADAYLPVNVRGGIGPYKYQWTVDKIDGVTLDADTSNIVELHYAQRLGYGANIVLKGNIYCTVTDMGQANRPTKKATAAISIVAYNPTSANPKGCIVFGSVISTIIGDKDAKDIRVGDCLSSYSRQPKDFRGWTASSLKGRPVYATVKAITFGTETHCYLINGQKFTHEHPILVLDNAEWKYLPARDVTRSMSTISRNGLIAVIYEAQKIDGDVDTIDIDVEPYDCYFVGDVLVHNADLVSKAEKN